MQKASKYDMCSSTLFPKGTLRSSKKLFLSNSSIWSIRFRPHYRLQLCRYTCSSKNGTGLRLCALLGDGEPKARFEYVAVG